MEKNYNYNFVNRTRYQSSGITSETINVTECKKSVLSDSLKEISNGKLYHTTDTNEFFYDWEGKRYELNLFGSSEAIEAAKTAAAEAKSAANEADRVAKEASETAAEVSALLNGVKTIQSVSEISNGYKLTLSDGSILELKNGENGATGATGAQGPVGPAGADGQDGADGADGADGKSAYELAVEAGFNGTLDAWLASLKGVDGADGADGKDGENGVDGKSAFELWKALEGNEEKTEDEFFASLKGADGADGQDGENGADGADGADGKSAFELWKALEGNEEKTEDEFFASLKGVDGQDGVTPTIVIDPNSKHWFINGVDSGVVAEGKDGEDGEGGSADANSIMIKDIPEAPEEGVALQSVITELLIPWISDIEQNGGSDSSIEIVDDLEDGSPDKAISARVVKESINDAMNLIGAEYAERVAGDESLQAAIDGKLNPLPLVDDPVDPGKGFPYHIPYNVIPNATADGITLTIKTITLDNNATKWDNTMELPAASTETAGLMTAADKVALEGKQDALVSGTNIKTINGVSILGEGNIVISGGDSDVDVADLESRLAETESFISDAANNIVVSTGDSDTMTLADVITTTVNDINGIYNQANGIFSRLDDLEDGAERGNFPTGEGAEDETLAPEGEADKVATIQSVMDYVNLMFEKKKSDEPVDDASYIYVGGYLEGSEPTLMRNMSKFKIEDYPVEGQEGVFALSVLASAESEFFDADNNDIYTYFNFSIPEGYTFVKCEIDDPLVGLEEKEFDNMGTVNYAGDRVNYTNYMRAAAEGDIWQSGFKYKITISKN